MNLQAAAAAFLQVELLTRLSRSPVHRIGRRFVVVTENLLPREPHSRH